MPEMELTTPKPLELNMNRSRGFNFKLLVPPRTNGGQVSVVRAQAVIGECTALKPTLQEPPSKCSEACVPAPISSQAATPSAPSRDLPKMKVVSPMEKDWCKETPQNSLSPKHVLTKMYDEVEKIKCWKIKVEADREQRERKMLENKKTIETQRKAIQELQFGIESLSIKLEKEISENENLRIKNNSTMNLCNMLKDSFQQSAAKTDVFEVEREEIHHLFIENREHIQKMTAEFENLRTLAETDQHEMQRTKECLLQSEDLMVKLQHKFDIQQEEAAVLQVKLNDKENELQEILAALQQTQESCKELKETRTQQIELLRNSKSEMESVLQKLYAAQQLCKDAETSKETITAVLEKTKKEYSQMVLEKNSCAQELNLLKKEHADKLEQMQTTIHELQKSLTLEEQRVMDLQDKLTVNNSELDKKCNLLREVKEQIAKKDEQISILQGELATKVTSIASLTSTITGLDIKFEGAVAELSCKTEEVQQLKNNAEKSFVKMNLLKDACTDAESAVKILKEELTTTERKVEDLCGQLSDEVRKNKECTHQYEQLKGETEQLKAQHEDQLSQFNKLLSEKNTIQKQHEGAASEMKVLQAEMKMTEENSMKLTTVNQRLEDENQSLRDNLNSLECKIRNEDQEKETLHEVNSVNEKQIKGMETKLKNLGAKLEAKTKALEECHKEKKILKKQIATEILKTTQLQNEIADSVKKQAEVYELEKEVKYVKCLADDALKNKEETVAECQQKIADMVALMEKHKSQYEKMVEEKDKELEDKKRKEMELVSRITSLEFELSKVRTEYDSMTQQLQTEITHKDNLQKKLDDTKKEISSSKNAHLSEKKVHTPKDTSAMQHVFDFTVTTSPLYIRRAGNTTAEKKTQAIRENIKSPSTRTPRLKQICKEDSKRKTKRVEPSTKIKSYRIRTPPSTPSRSGINLDPKSDSSDQTASLDMHMKFLKKGHSPVIPCKSPGNALKLAAIKRMRDAGWTAVTGASKRKRERNDNCFG